MPEDVICRDRGPLFSGAVFARRPVCRRRRHANPILESMKMEIPAPPRTPGCSTRSGRRRRRHPGRRHHHFASSSRLVRPLAAHTGLSAEQGGHLQRLVGEIAAARRPLVRRSAAFRPEATLPESSVPESPAGFPWLWYCADSTRLRRSYPSTRGRPRGRQGRCRAAVGDGPAGDPHRLRHHAGESIRRDLTLVPLRRWGDRCAHQGGRRRRAPACRRRSSAPITHRPTTCTKWSPTGPFRPTGTEAGLSTPRAGDGFVRIDANGLVRSESPNALSAFHRMGFKQ